MKKRKYTVGGLLSEGNKKMGYKKYVHVYNAYIYKTIAHGFLFKMAPKSPPIFITFSDSY